MLSKLETVKFHCFAVKFSLFYPFLLPAILDIEISMARTVKSFVTREFLFSG